MNFITITHFYSTFVQLAAAAAKSLQLCPTLCDPIDGSPSGFPIPGILQARTLEWVAISFSNAWKWKVKVKLLSHVQLLATPWTATHQAPPSMGFSRQEYWSGVPLPSPLYSLGEDKSLCFNFIFQYMRMRIEPMLMDYCKDKVNHDWIKESIQAYFVVIIISVMYICLLSISLSRLSASGRQNSWHIYFGVTTV